MRRRSTVLVVCAAAAATVAAAARGDGLPVLGIDAGGTGVVAADGRSRYVTIPAGPATVLARVRVPSGQIDQSRLLSGTLTIPAVAYDGSAAGLSGDGSTLVLIEPRTGFP